MRASWLLTSSMVLGCGLSDVGEQPPPPDATAGADSSQQRPGDEETPPADARPSDAAPADASVKVDASGDAPAMLDARDDGAVAADAPDAADAPPDGRDGAAVTGPAIQFDGNASYVACGSVPIPGQFTAEAWINPSESTRETYILAEDRQDQHSGEFRFGLVASGQLFFMMSDGTGNSFGLFTTTYQVISPSPLPMQTWSQVAVVKNSSQYSLLINGVAVTAFTASGSFVFNDGGQQNPFRIGARVASDGSSPDGVFAGIIDEVRFWNAPRTPAQISADMNHRIQPNDPGWSTLTQYWPFAEGAGLTTADTTGPYPGTLTNGAVWVMSAPF